MGASSYYRVCRALSLLVVSRTNWFGFKVGILPQGLRCSRLPPWEVISEEASFLCIVPPVSSGLTIIELRGLSNSINRS